MDKLTLPRPRPGDGHEASYYVGQVEALRQALLAKPSLQSVIEPLLDEARGRLDTATGDPIRSRAVAMRSRSVGGMTLIRGRIRATLTGGFETIDALYKALRNSKAAPGIQPIHGLRDRWAKDLSTFKEKQETKRKK